ncbi:hypothetical protein [Paracoccus salsus]|uniref:hypothetical protein n=1 Tax=Paracoccus salsus TaxID=2911061 RepID=UPI001F1B708F|nr:hypothetical protein [Paracoccus salsus]MCF3974008.1 hypothetical protein [Paracoccus salsus]
MTEFESELRELSAADGSWDAVEQSWSRECREHGEDLDEYAIGSLPVVKDLADTPHQRTRALGLFDTGGRCHAICQANVAVIPGYKEPVLRVRHLLLSPAYDFGDLDGGAYAMALTSVFAGVVKAAFTTLPAKHVHFHLRSPADVSFFGAVAKTLASLPTFETVQMRGAWLYLTLKEMPQIGRGS